VVGKRLYGIMSLIPDVSFIEGLENDVREIGEEE
jgi:hypothetical protein